MVFVVVVVVLVFVVVVVSYRESCFFHFLTFISSCNLV